MKTLIACFHYFHYSVRYPFVLSRFVEVHPDFCIIDPFKNIYPLLDRLQIQKILVRLQELGTERKPKLRAPYSLKVIVTWLLFKVIGSYLSVVPLS